MSTTIVSQNSIQSKPSLPPGNALKEFYGTPELYGKSIGYVGQAFRFDLVFSDQVGTCPHCGTNIQFGYMGRYDGHRMGLIVCAACNRITGAY